MALTRGTTRCCTHRARRLSRSNAPARRRRRTRASPPPLSRSLSNRAQASHSQGDPAITHSPARTCWTARASEATRARRRRSPPRASGARPPMHAGSAVRTRRRDVTDKDLGEPGGLRRVEVSGRRSECDAPAIAGERGLGLITRGGAPLSPSRRLMRTVLPVRRSRSRDLRAQPLRATDGRSAPATRRQRSARPLRSTAASASPRSPSSTISVWTRCAGRGRGPWRRRSRRRGTARARREGDDARRRARRRRLVAVSVRRPPTRRPSARDTSRRLAGDAPPPDERAPVARAVGVRVHDRLAVAGKARQEGGPGRAVRGHAASRCREQAVIERTAPLCEGSSPSPESVAS